MKKLLTFLTLLTLFFGVGWAEETVYYTLDGNQSTGGNSTPHNSYSAAAETTQNGITWSIMGNSNMTPWRIGGKSISTTDRPIYSLTPMESSISRIEVSLGTISNTDLTVNRIQLIVASDADFNNIIDTKIAGTPSANSTTAFTPTTGSEWATNSYYKINIMVTNTTSSNCYVQFLNAKFYTGGGSTVETVATPTFSPAEGTYTEAQNVTISCTTSGATIHYTTDGATPTTSSPTYSSAIPVSETKTIKAIAVKSGMNNSDVATATYTINIPQPSTSTVYERVTSLSASDVGKEFVFVCENKKAAMGTIGSYGTSISVSNLTNGTLTVNSEAVVPFTLGGSADQWTFANNGSYINWSSGNSLGTATSVTSKSQWKISFSGNNATILNASDNSRKLRYNSSSPRFACYTSEQTVIQLYRKQEASASSLYLIGQDMNSQSGWNISTGPEFTYNSSADTYAVDAYFDMASRGYFQFVEGLSDSNSNWGGLTGRYYASGSSDVAVDTYDMDGTVPLYFTNSTDYSPGQYAFTVPAGIYTIVVDKANWQIFVTQHDVTMEISPNSATFETTKNVTLSSNLTALGGKIYYTTDGSTPSASNGTEYTGTITLEATTTIKAIAILNYIQSEVAEKTYTKTPTAPVISPASCTFNEPITVTITAESGATIYYTTDGSDPTNESTQYNGPFTVSTTTTVKAIAYVGEAYSSVAEATYTYSNVQPSTGDFVLVTSADQLVAGNEYIIMTKDADGYTHAMGDIVSNKGSWTQEFNINGTVGTAGSTVSVYSESTTTSSLVNILELENTNGQLALKQQSAGTYLNITSNSTDIKGSASKTYLTITIDDDYYATIKSYSTRQILFYTTNDVYGNYASSNVGNSGYSNVYLYTRATNSVQPPVFSPIAGIYNVDIDVTISCATDGATIYYTTDGTEPSATNGTEYKGEIIVSENTTFKAIAVKGENSSSVVTAEYVIQKSTDIATVTLTYSEPFTEGIGKFFITNNTGFSPVWTLDGNYGIKGTSFSGGVNYAAQSRLVSPIIDMTGSVQPELTFSHQNNGYFNDITTQCQVFIRETTDGTDGTWVQIPITFTVLGQGNWSNDLADIDLTDVNGVSYADKKVQISFLYTNLTEGTGAGTWEIQSFRVADNSEYRMVNNIAEFLALENGEKAKFKNPVTVLYDYAQRGDQEYIWVKDESGYMQFFLQPTLNSSTESTIDPKAAYYENGDIIPAGFVVVKNYFENGKYVQAYSTEALDAGFLPTTQKGLADPDHYEFKTLNELTLSDADIAANCNRYITVEKVKIASKSGKNFTFANENDTVNACVGYNKYNGDGSLLKGGTTSADVTIPAVSDTTYYNVKGIIQIWQGGWEFMPIEFTEWKVDEVTLRKLCADGVENNEYKISNNLMGVYASEDGTKLWVKDDTGQSIWPDAPDATYKDNFPINAEGNTRLDQQYYDQSNWCEIQLTSQNAGNFVGKIIKGGAINGTFTNKTNPTMTGVTLTNDDIYRDGSYEPNYYIPCNFYGNQSCHTSQHGQPGHGDYFFMTPKPQEYAMIVWAIWDSKNDQFVVNENPKYNSHGFQGSFKVNLSLNQNPNIELHDGMEDNFAYNFSAIIRVNSSKAGSDFMVYPLDLSAATDPATAIESVVAGNGEVKSVKYVNVAGMVSDVPFQGVNIVVTEYTDGSRTTSKMLKR